MSKPPHIVVVDDHRDIRELLSAYLSRHAFRVTALDGAAALHALLSRQKADLIVLDVMMPGEDGLTACRQIRRGSDAPILFLTAMAEETDRIVGIELGADDYLAKPFNPRELLARIRAILRRTSGEPTAATAAATTAEAQIARFHDWRLDLKRRELYSAEGLGVSLSTAEFRLLCVFLDRPHRVLTRDQLLDLTVGRAAGPYDRSVDNQVSRLRKKIEPDPKTPMLLQTHWGGGYRLSTDVEFS